MKKIWIWQAARAQADQLHNQDRANLVADGAVPLTATVDISSWQCRHLVPTSGTCLLEGMLKSSHIHVNYDKIREVTQEKDENPALFLSQLTEAVQKYTILDISTPTRFLYLHVQFISQSAPDTHQKRRQFEKGPETAQRDLLEIAFKVFNNREGERKRKKKRKERPNVLCSLQLSKEKLQPLWPANLKPHIWDLTLQAPASDVTKRDTGPNPAQTPRHPPNPAPPANNGNAGKWIVFGHYPPNLGVHPRPSNVGSRARLWGALAPQTMAPRMREESTKLYLNYSSDGA